MGVTNYKAKVLVSYYLEPWGITIFKAKARKPFIFEGGHLFSWFSHGVPRVLNSEGWVDLPTPLETEI